MKKAVDAGHFKVAELLLSEGAKIQASEYVLSAAARKGDRALVELLIRHGIDVNVVDRINWTPLHHAVYRRHGAVSDFLRPFYHACGQGITGHPAL